jgi:hypothetical protein
VKNPYTPLKVALVQVAAEAEPTAAIMVKITMATPETAELNILLLELVLQNRIFLHSSKFVEVTRTWNAEHCRWPSFSGRVGCEQQAANILFIYSGRVKLKLLALIAENVMLFPVDAGAR